MDKYYTPEIEEFHVGFEYEHLQDEEMFGEITRGINYCLYTLDAQDELEVIVANLEDDRLRVKHLDKEDIESLGFKQDHNHNDVRFGYTNGSTRIQHTPHRNNIEIYQWGHESDTVSGITIKNKSELKRLLKQLNIIE